ncbi:MAG: hypothetical protein H0V43_00030 [Gemmatimonadales bacterium]|nr:hypothetical protein [Gemmatimonadales bacterium]
MSKCQNDYHPLRNHTHISTPKPFSLILIYLFFSLAREWDRFFLKTIPEQRAFMKEFLKAQTRRKNAATGGCGVAECERMEISAPADQQRAPSVSTTHS